MEIYWVAMIDVDQYIVLENSHNTNAPLQTALLDDYQDRHALIGAL
jgi:hypothetical protein